MPNVQFSSTYKPLLPRKDTALAGNKQSKPRLFMVSNIRGNKQTKIGQRQFPFLLPLSLAPCCILAALKPFLLYEIEQNHLVCTF